MVPWWGWLLIAIFVGLPLLLLGARLAFPDRMARSLQGIFPEVVAPVA